MVLKIKSNLKQKCCQSKHTNEKTLDKALWPAACRGGYALASGEINVNEIIEEKVIIKESEVEQFDFDGLVIKDYTAKLDENSSFATISVLPQISHKLSWSKRSDKFYYIIAGKINFIINENEYFLSNGDLCVIKKGEKFKYKNDSNETVRMILVHTPNFKLDQEVFE